MDCLKVTLENGECWAFNERVHRNRHSGYSFYWKDEHLPSLRERFRYVPGRRYEVTEEDFQQHWRFMPEDGGYGGQELQINWLFLNKSSWFLPNHIAGIHLWEGPSIEGAVETTRFLWRRGDGVALPPFDEPLEIYAATVQEQDIVVNCKGHIVARAVDIGDLLAVSPCSGELNYIKS